MSRVGVARLQEFLCAELAGGIKAAAFGWEHLLIVDGKGDVTSRQTHVRRGAVLVMAREDAAANASSQTAPVSGQKVFAIAAGEQHG